LDRARRPLERTVATRNGAVIHVDSRYPLTGGLRRRRRNQRNQHQRHGSHKHCCASHGEPPSLPSGYNSTRTQRALCQVSSPDRSSGTRQHEARTTERHWSGIVRASEPEHKRRPRRVRRRLIVATTARANRNHMSSADATVKPSGRRHLRRVAGADTAGHSRDATDGL
jgi:hypothetical protein